MGKTQNYVQLANRRKKRGLKKMGIDHLPNPGIINNACSNFNLWKQIKLGR